jgi:hypothetical protein
MIHSPASIPIGNETNVTRDIIRLGEKLVCQLFFWVKWFVWCWLGGILGFEGLDTGICWGFCGSRIPPIAKYAMDGAPARPHLSRDETAAKMGHPAIFPVRAMGYELCGMRMERPVGAKATANTEILAAPE